MPEQLAEGDDAFDSAAENVLVATIRAKWRMMLDHWQSSGLDSRLLQSLMAFRGEYSPEELASIRLLQGSEVYSRITATKCRGATALLRSIFFSPDKPWALEPTPEPTMDPGAMEAVTQMVAAEVQLAAQQGVPVSEADIAERAQEAYRLLKNAVKDKLRKETAEAESRIEDILVEGGFYTALGEVLVDLPMFPYAVLKGPEVRFVDEVSYLAGAPKLVRKPKLFWRRVNPFDIMWTPGATTIQHAEVCERRFLTLHEFRALADLPGWRRNSILQALMDYSGGIFDWITSSDTERARYEARESPTVNRSGMIAILEYHGYVLGRELNESNVDLGSKIVDDEVYSVVAYVCGRHLLHVRMASGLGSRHPYAITSFDKMPGTVVGMSLVDMLADVQSVANTALRSIANNMALASGPQVVIDTARLDNSEDATTIYPWKRWLLNDSPFTVGTRFPPIEFFQPASVAQELMTIYQQLTQIADEVSAIPRYITGSGATGGAGRTASGLNMLMQNADKLLQQVAHNVDTDLIGRSLNLLYETLIVSDAGVTLRGDETIVVRGVSRVVAREVERTRQLEFLQITSNPVDLQILGIEGRAELLRALADDLNLPGQSIVPDRETLAARLASEQQAVHNGADQPGVREPKQEQTNTVRKRSV